MSTSTRLRIVGAAWFAAALYGLGTGAVVAVAACAASIMFALAEIATLIERK